MRAHLKPDERYLLMLLMDRYKLSVANNWRTAEGEYYCFFTVKDIQTRLGCGNKKAIEMLDHLEDAGLIRRIPSGRGYPNKLIVALTAPGQKAYPHPDCG